MAKLHRVKLTQYQLKVLWCELQEKVQYYKEHHVEDYSKYHIEVRVLRDLIGKAVYGVKRRAYLKGKRKHVQSI